MARSRKTGGDVFVLAVRCVLFVKRQNASECANPHFLRHLTHSFSLRRLRRPRSYYGNIRPALWTRMAEQPLRTITQLTLAPGETGTDLTSTFSGPINA